MNHECKGCLSYNEPMEILNCSLQNVSIPKGVSCPCSICLIKGICRCECEDFVIFCNRVDVMIKKGMHNEPSM